MALVVLALGFVGLCSFEVPMKVGVSDFVQAARGGEVSEVRIDGTSSATGVHIFWSTGYLQDYESTYQYEMLSSTPAEERFEADVKRRIGGSEGSVVFESGSRFDALGFADFLLPVMHWRIMPYFAWPVAFFCAVALVGMICRSDLRAESAGYWLGLSLIVGFGFPAYYWSEPRPLCRLRRAGTDRRSVMRARRVVGATACWGLLGGVVVYSFVLLRR